MTINGEGKSEKRVELGNGICFPPVRTGSEDAGFWEAFFSFARELEEAGENTGKSWIYLSDLSVYGKLYGTPRLISEEELGYACHTSAKDQEAWRGRLLEHLFFETAQEAGVCAMVLRLNKEALQAPVSENLEKVLQKILEKGGNGEIYNYSEVMGRLESEISPLSPLTIVPDTGKVRSLL